MYRVGPTRIGCGMTKIIAYDGDGYWETPFCIRATQFLLEKLSTYRPFRSRTPRPYSSEASVRRAIGHLFAATEHCVKAAECFCFAVLDLKFLQPLMRAVYWHQIQTRRGDR